MMTGSHKFEVRSERNQSICYKVDFGSSDREPSCQYWSFRSSYLSHLEMEVMLQIRRWAGRLTPLEIDRNEREDMSIHFFTDVT